MNLENLSMRLASEVVNATLAIYDMCESGAIYQSQSNFEYYRVEKFTGNVYQLNRFESKWVKLGGIMFKTIYGMTWKKVEDSK